MGAKKNMVRGFIFTIIYILMTLVIPFMTFTWIKNLGQIQGSEIAIAMDESRYNTIIFWISAFGLIISGTAFFAYSAPSQSIRRGIFALIQIILNCLYIWSYKFSGATEIEFILIVGNEQGSIALNFADMVMMYLGIYFLTIILKTYDLIDFTVNRKKIRAKRRGEIEIDNARK
ncbi:MAG: hypothetical protein ACTSVV_17015 [Promethearchaeota archaeon]